MKFRINSLKSLKKPYLIVFIIIAACLILFTPSDDDKRGDAADYKAENVIHLEKRLKNILSKIHGAGRVDVMITLESEGEKIILKDSQTNDSENLFGDVSGPTFDEKTVMQKDGSKEEPFVRKKTKAEVRGVIVCADGAYDDVVKNEIMSSCVAVLDVPVTRVSVVRRKE